MISKLLQLLRVPNWSSSPGQAPDLAKQGYSYESLWNDFEARSYLFSHVRPVPGSTDLRLLHWVGSIDRSGYIREQCLRWLIAHYRSGDENRILLRLADWVRPVRAVAREWVTQHFKELPLDSIRANQRLLLYLSRKEGMQEDPGFQEIERELLARAATMDPGSISKLEPSFRRYLYSLSMSRGGGLRNRILDDADPFNRVLILAHVNIGKLTPTELERLQGDRSVLVRRRLLYARIESGEELGKDELVRVALDPNQGLRSIGRYYLKKLHDLKAYDLYRTLNGPRFYYIADYARKEDCGYFLDGIRTGDKYTRSICLRALALADNERLRELDLESMIRAGRWARTTLVSHLPHLLRVDEIVALKRAFEESSAGGTVSFLRVLEKKSFWAFLDCALEYLISGAPPAVEEFILGEFFPAALYQPLSRELRARIEGKIYRLGSAQNGRYSRLASELEFRLPPA